MTTSALRTQIELEQPLPNFRGFTTSTSDGTAATVLTVSSIMEEANRITFVVELGDLYINFGGAATSDGTSMLVPAGISIEVPSLVAAPPKLIYKSPNSTTKVILFASSIMEDTVRTVEALASDVVEVNPLKLGRGCSNSIV